MLAEEVFEEVGHAQWVFVMPKMLRPYFLHHRALLGGLAYAARDHLWCERLAHTVPARN